MVLGSKKMVKKRGRKGLGHLVAPVTSRGKEKMIVGKNKKRVTDFE